MSKEKTNEIVDALISIKDEIRKLNMKIDSISYTLENIDLQKASPSRRKVSKWLKQTSP